MQASILRSSSSPSNSIGPRSAGLRPPLRVFPEIGGVEIRENPDNDDSRPFPSQNRRDSVQQTEGRGQDKPNLFVGKLKPLID